MALSMSDEEGSGFLFAADPLLLLLLSLTILLFVIDAQLTLCGYDDNAKGSAIKYLTLFSTWLCAKLYAGNRVDNVSAVS